MASGVLVASALEAGEVARGWTCKEAAAAETWRRTADPEDGAVARGCPSLERGEGDGRRSGAEEALFWCSDWSKTSPEGRRPCIGAACSSFPAATELVDLCSWAVQWYLRERKKDRHEREGD